MADLFLVACVAKKLDHPAPAKELYVSPWFKLARAYVEARTTDWFILSAKFGLLRTDTVIEPYDTALTQMRLQDRQAWASRVTAQLEQELPHRIPRIVVLAGLRYRDLLMEVLGRHADAVEVPLEGMTIGKQLGWLKRG
jgi:hypothetical protein